MKKPATALTTADKRIERWTERRPGMVLHLTLIGEPSEEAFEALVELALALSRGNELVGNEVPEVPIKEAV